jgi:hypothetical protein
VKPPGRKRSFSHHHEDVRRKKEVYFSDYDKVFFYRSDKSCAVPDQCVPIMYTREMHDRVKLNIF